LEAVFAARVRTVDGHLGIRTQNPSNGQDFAFRCAVQGENVGILAFESRELVVSSWLVAREETAGEDGQLCHQAYDDNASHEWFLLSRIEPPDGRRVSGERRAEGDERGPCTRMSGGSTTGKHAVKEQCTDCE